MPSSARKSIGRQASALQALCKLNKSQRLALLRSADNDLVRSICECAFNTLKGSVTLKRTEKTRLAKHRKVLRRLASKRGSWKSKKRILVQQGGGFLPMLLAPILGTLLSNIFGQ